MIGVFNRVHLVASFIDDYIGINIRFCLRAFASMGCGFYGFVKI
jgi:hypothetical protein